MPKERAVPEEEPSASSSHICSRKGRPYLLAAAILASALGFIDGSVVAIALPAMRESLGATLGQTQWFSNAYMLTLSGLILVGGAAGDRFGIARVFGGGIALFVAASIACGLAPNPATLIAARAIQGVGAAMMVPGSLALIARAYPPGERGRAIGIWAAASAATTAAGPLIGGALLSVAGGEAWRAVFLVNLPLGAAALYLLTRYVERDKAETPAAQLDIGGAVLATLAVGTFALALTAGGHAEPPAIGETVGPSGPSLPLLGLSIAAAVAFIAVERRVPAPMLPLHLFRSRPFSVANASTFLLYVALSGILFFLPMTLIAGWQRSPLEASLVFIPLTIAIAVLSPAMGRLAERIGPRLPIAGGSLVVALGYATMAAAAPWQGFWTGILPGGALAGIGMALVVAPLSTAVMADAGASDTGAASGVNNAVARSAGLVAVAAFGPLAVWAYAMAGGPLDFGAMVDDAPHGAAMSSAFAVLAAIASGLALLSALTAWIGLRDERPKAMSP